MNKPFIVAELGASHQQSFLYAQCLIDAAASSGADAVKFQTYTPQDMAAADVVIPSGPWAGQTYCQLYNKGAMPVEWLPPLFQQARSLGLVPFSSPFSVKAVQQLEQIDCEIYKIASPEIAHYPLIAAAARTGKRLIISTGMATFAEIRQAVGCAYAHGCEDVNLLHCISSYPANAQDFNLNTLKRLQEIYPGRVGLSDHSLDSTAAIIAVSMGANIIEKHFILNRQDGGPDAAFSLEPHEFAKMVKAVRDAAAAMGDVVFGVREAERTSAQYRRSVWLVKPIRAGEVITKEHLAILRPNHGEHPVQFHRFIGQRAAADYKADTPMKWSMVE